MRHHSMQLLRARTGTCTCTSCTLYSRKRISQQALTSMSNELVISDTKNYTVFYFTGWAYNFYTRVDQMQISSLPSASIKLPTYEYSPWIILIFSRYPLCYFGNWEPKNAQQKKGSQKKMNFSNKERRGNQEGKTKECVHKRHGKIKLIQWSASLRSLKRW